MAADKQDPSSSAPSWLELSVGVASSEVPLLEELLYALEAETVSVFDAGDQPLLEPGVNETPLWDDSVVKALFRVQDDATVEEQRQRLNDTVAATLAEFPELGQAALTITLIEDQDWLRNCLDQFKPIAFQRGLRIVPSWEQPDRMASSDVLLDPGLAFGTGTHASTYLCLDWLDQQAPLKGRVIDFGCGSGILGIAALKLGAEQVYFIDNDPQALTASLDNLSRNQIASDRYTTIDLSNKSGQSALRELYQQPVDTILANILAATLLELQAQLAALLVPNGALMLAGILNSQADSVVEAYRQQFQDFVLQQREDWTGINAVKQP